MSFDTWFQNSSDIYDAVEVLDNFINNNHLEEFCPFCCFDNYFDVLWETTKGRLVCCKNCRTIYTTKKG